MKILLAVFIQLISIAGIAQVRSINGTVTDSTGHPIRNVSIVLQSGVDTFSTATDTAGNFRIKNKISDNFIIRIHAMEYQSFSKAYSIDPDINIISLDAITLRVSIKDLQEIILTPTNPVTIKEDTVEYRTDAYKVKEGAVVEDVLKKLPGVTVDREGNIIAQGKEIQAIRVNGKDYFGGDVKTATQNLPANIVENIQIIDDYGEKAKHTGVKAGEPEKILNINIKKDKNKGAFGNATVAAGTQDRYLATLSANNFNDEKQISAFATLNNINASGYEFSGSPRGNRNTNNANIASGINQLSSAAVNHRTVWAKRLTSNTSYNLSAARNANSSAMFLQDFNPVNINTIKSNNLGESQNQSHRLAWNLEYKFDSSGFLKIFPFISSSNSKNSQQTNAEYNRPKYYTKNIGRSQSEDRTPSWGTDVFFLRKLRKERTLTLSANINRTLRNQDRDVSNDFFNTDSSNTLPFSNYLRQSQNIENEYLSTRTSIAISLSQAIGKYGILEGSYGSTHAASESLREVNDIDQLTGEKTRNMSQSNDYTYQFTTNRLGVSLSTRKKKYNYYLAVAAQPSLLTGTDIRRNISTRNANFNLVPSARIGYKFSQNKSFTATYNGSSREPGFNQLQPVSDSSNLKNIITGNPDLQPEFTNRFNLQFNKAGHLSGRSLFANLQINEVQNKIVTARVNDAAGTGRTTTFVNANGFRGLNGSISVSQPFQKKKIIVSFTGSGSFDNNISFTDNQRNSGNNWSFRPGLNVRVDLPDLLDLNVGAGYVYNKSTTRYPNYSYTSKVKTLQFAIDGRYYFLKYWTLGYDFTKNIFIGYLKTFNATPSMLNLHVERKFLKNNKGLIRLQGFDLFNENVGISRSINGTTVTDVEANRLSRYFMVSFSYRLQKFVK